MNYNEFSYYRANPYHKQNYMPPIAFLNRKPNSYLVEMPQGDNHLQRPGRRLYSVHFKSNIDQEKLLTSPQKYPYENRIAMEKSYLRNLNTIDIEGASPNSMISMAVKNKMKAQQQLSRRELDPEEAEHLRKTKLSNISPDDRRRQLALKQVAKSKQFQQLISKRQTNSNAQHYAQYKSINLGKDNQDKQKNSNFQQLLNAQSMKSKLKQQKKPYQSQPKIQKMQYRSRDQLQYFAEKQPNLQSIHKQEVYNHENYKKQIQKQEQLINNDNYASPKLNYPNYQTNNLNIEKRNSIKQQEINLSNYINPNRQDMRKKSPTHLSYASPSFRLAGKNIVGY